MEPVFTPDEARFLNEAQAFFDGTWKPYSPFKAFSTAVGFNSQFNGNALGWVKRPGALWNVTSTAYGTNGIAYRVSSASYPKNYANFTYQARMKRLGYADNYGGYAGIVVRGAPSFDSIYDWKTGYEFVYSSYYRDFIVVRKVNGVWTTLKNWTISPAIVQNGWNTLKVVASGTSLSVYPCRPHAPRGVRAQLVVCDEVAYYLSSENRPVDREMLRAVRPCLATTGGRLIVLSSPYGQSGALWDLHRQHYGRDESATLVWQASAPEMNPTLPADYLSRMEADDPEAYRSEVLGEFRAGIASLLDPDALDAVVVPDRRELPPSRELFYSAFVDPSGGRSPAIMAHDFFRAPEVTEKGRRAAGIRIRRRSAGTDPPPPPRARRCGPGPGPTRAAP